MARTKAPTPARISTVDPNLPPIPEDLAEAINAMDHSDGRTRVKEFYERAMPPGGYKLWAADGDPITTEEAISLVHTGTGRISGDDYEEAAKNVDWMVRALRLGSDARLALEAPIREEAKLRKEGTRMRMAAVDEKAERQKARLIEESGLADEFMIVEAEMTLSAQETAEILGTDVNSLYHRAGRGFPAAVTINGQKRWRLSAVRRAVAR